MSLMFLHVYTIAQAHTGEQREIRKISKGKLDIILNRTKLCRLILKNKNQDIVKITNSSQSSNLPI